MSDSELLNGAEVGRSAFARITAMIYWVIVLTVLFGLVAAPGWVASLFIAPDPSNWPLFMACLLPVGPGVSAMVFAWRRRALEGPDLSPAARFFRGYRLNAVDVLRWWAPYLIVVALGGFVAANIGLTGLPTGLVWVLVALGFLSALWAGHMMILTSVFSFRTRDAARLSLFCSVRCVGVTLLFASLIVVCVAATALIGMWAPLLFAGVLAAMYVRAAAPAMTLVTEQFTGEGVAADEWTLPDEEADDGSTVSGAE
ncbi:MAG: hypothetical protein LBV06_00975 [Propionibacteriaceae bacterium]|jgi:hypothetical protein|nr:hypothetical protein [Propionibacteriaceae bacterium]